MKWHLILQLSRTNYKMLAISCDSPCEKLHNIAHYDTGDMQYSASWSDCILFDYNGSLFQYYYWIIITFFFYNPNGLL